MTSSQSAEGALRRGLSPGERLIWAGQQLDVDAPLYNMAVAIHIDARLNPVLLREALNRVARGADALRSIIADGGAGPECLVLPAVDLKLDVIDIGDPVESAAVRTMLEERARHIQPLDAPMTDVALVLGPRGSVLFINQHHLVTDATSTGLLYRRLSDEYLALRDGTAVPDRFPQFADHVEAVTNLQGTPEFGKARAHWESPNAPDGLATLFYGNGSDGRGRTERVRVPLGPQRTEALERLARRPEFRALSAGHSRFLVFSTVLSAWTTRVTDRETVSIGVPSHNRMSVDHKNTLGLFIELFPIRVDVPSDSTLSQLGRSVASATLDMMRHAVPGSSAVPGARDFSVVLNYITAELGSFAGAPGRVDWVHTGWGDPAHAVRLQVHDFDGSGIPTLDFDLDQSVFGVEERRWAVEHFLALFDALVADPDREVSAIELVSWEEEARFAPRGSKVDVERGVLASFGESVSQWPEAVAVTAEGRDWSYSELSRAAIDLAGRMAAKGVVTGDVVGILLERGFSQIVAMLALHRLGAAYVPLDPAHPVERLHYQATDSAMSLVVAGPGDERPGLWGVGSLTIDPARLPASLVDESDAWEDPPSDTLAYLLYTSGSTGRPKGVEVTHGALAEYVSWARGCYDRGERLTWAWFTSPAFDLTVTSILTPLVSGGRVLTYPESGEADGLVVRQVFADDRVEAVKLTPSHLELVRDLDLTGSRVRRLIVGGESLRVAVARRTVEAFGSDVELYNEYGPTEATVACMIHRFAPEIDHSGSVPIGVPADNMRIHVLTRAGTPTVRGESGEICIAGPRVARGYRGRPDLSAEVFSADPLEPSGRMYRSGDRGRWSARGVLEFLGRADDQVKVGGHRLELGEVDAVLERHPDVREVASMVVETDRHDDDRRCTDCGLEGRHPEARLDSTGRCQLCVRFERERAEVSRYFGSEADLEALLARARTRASGPHDCIMLYSGGKDSTYALCRIVEMGAWPLVFLLDNGFISEQAKENVRRVTDLLGLELVVGAPKSMPAIFAESLSRFSNVCQGCFKTVYTMALNLAVERGIPAVVTGLSRGQIFETRLADLYRRRIYDPEVVDRHILDARRAYHGMDDAVAPLLRTGPMSLDEVLEDVQFIDFYRYVDVELDHLLEYVRERTPWIRPSDTGRSTNCLINEAGIFVHLTERGFHNYALPYSWDVRLGHKQRDAAVRELQDELDPANVRRMLDRVGYRERPFAKTDRRLVTYYVAHREVDSAELRALAAEHLPTAVIPAKFIRLEAMPLGRHGKIDRSALPVPRGERSDASTQYVEPSTSTQWLLAEVWSEVLGIDRIGIDDDFFALGGESMRCIQIASLARDRGLDVSPRDLFRHPTIAKLAAVVQGASPAPAFAPAEASAAELADLADEFGA